MDKDLYYKDFEMLDGDLVMLYSFYKRYVTIERYLDGRKPDESIMKAFIWDNEMDYDISIDDRKLNILKEFIKDIWKDEHVLVFEPKKRWTLTQLRDFVTNIY